MMLAEARDVHETCEQAPHSAQRARPYADADGVSQQPQQPATPPHPCGAHVRTSRTTHGHGHHADSQIRSVRRVRSSPSNMFFVLRLGSRSHPSTAAERSSLYFILFVCVLCVLYTSISAECTRSQRASWCVQFWMRERERAAHSIAFSQVRLRIGSSGASAVWSNVLMCMLCMQACVYDMFVCVRGAHGCG